MPSKETSGASGGDQATDTTQLPLSRVKRLVALDPDLQQCSNPGAFLITQATELFIQHLASSAHAVVRSERKPRKNIAYKDLSAAVARSEQLEFLSDVVPKTVTYKEAKAKKGKPSGASGVENGPKQTTLGNGWEVVIEQKRKEDEAAARHSDGRKAEESEGNSEDANPEEQLQAESRKERLSLTNKDGIMNGVSSDDDEDVQMQ